MRWAAITVLALAVLQPAPAYAERTDSAGSAESGSPIKVFLDTENLVFTQEPLLLEGSTYVPFRPLFEAMGMSVQWDASTRTVKGSMKGLSLELPVDQAEARVNGKPVRMEQSAILRNGITLVPLRFVGEATGSIVHWDGVNREISIVTERVWTALGITKEELQQKLDAWNEQMSRPSPGSGTPAPTQPTVPAAELPGSGGYVPAGGEVQLDELKGMYYGLRDDFGGYECGGMCWDIYTFLPDNRILLGPPPHGGPETIDCARDKCDTYAIQDGELKLGSGISYPIGKAEDGSLKIRDVALEPVKPAPDGLFLNDTYMNVQYRGLIGIDVFASSTRSFITFTSNGTFETTDLSIASFDVTQSSGSSEGKGTYRIYGNTLELQYPDGQTARVLFFLHDDGGKDIQVGSDLFYRE